MRRLSRVLAIRPGEGRPVALLAGAFATVEAGRGLGEVGVDTLVLSRSGAAILPMLYVGLGLVSLVVTLAYGTALARSSSQRFFPGLLLGLGAVLAVEWVVALSGAEAILPLVWISVYAAGMLLLTATWTVGSYSFDTRQAKRLFPLLTSAAIVGSLAGFLSAIVVQRMVGAPALILAEAGLLAVAAALLAGLGPRARPRRAPGASTPGVVTALTGGARYVAASPLMRLAAVAYVLLAVLLFSLTFPFMSALGAAFPDEAELLTVLALFSAAVTGASFAAGTLLAGRLFARFGVATVALVLPVMYLAGFGLWVVRFTTATAMMVRFAVQVTQRGVSNAAWSAFYTVIPGHRRGQVLAFMDGVPGQLGTILSGLLLMLATSMAMEQVFLVGLATALLCTAVVALIRRAYARSLVATLREGRAEQVLEGGPGLGAMGRDARVVAELRAATASATASERLLAADVLRRLGATESLPELRRLCADDDPSVRRVAVTALSELGGPGAADVLRTALDDPAADVREGAVAGLGRVGLLADPSHDLEGLLHDESPLVRGELAVGLAICGRVSLARPIVEAMLRSNLSSERAAALDAVARADLGLGAGQIEEHLADGSSHVRAAALRAAVAHSDGGGSVALAALDDPSLLVRTTAVSIARTRPDAGPVLLDVVRGGSERAQQAALWALDGLVDPVREDLLAWSEGQLARASELRHRGAPLAAADPSTTAAYLGRVIGRREAAIESRLLQALAVLGTPEAGSLIRRCLHAPDPEVRAQAIEALETLGDTRLARGVVRLLERDGTEAPASSADVIVAAGALVDDRDPWVRALALRTLSEHFESGRRSIVARVTADPDPLVASVVEIQKGEAVPDGLQLVSDIERMLMLRRVPLFESLDPEDLHRVAAAATERSWAEGDRLMVEGDVGDELVVIVEGDVRVVHLDGEQEHALRTYGPGNHIGELAVLREAPRAATVIAEAPGVRGLVIDGEALRALLHERPGAAMAMLATLAERISQEA